MFTSTRTSEPACKTFPGAMPTAFLLKIFSTAVRPCPSTETSFEAAKTEVGSISKILAAIVWIFLPKTIA